MKLEKLLKGFERAVVSFYSDSYPLAFPLTNFRISGNKMVIPKPKGLQLKITTANACVLFHTHNEFVKKIKSVTLYGKITLKGGELEFEAKTFSSFKQGGFLNTLRFILRGKRRTRDYFKKHMKMI